MRFPPATGAQFSGWQFVCSRRIRKQKITNSFPLLLDGPQQHSRAIRNSWPTLHGPNFGLDSFKKLFESAKVLQYGEWYSLWSEIHLSVYLSDNNKTLAEYAREPDIPYGFRVFCTGRGTDRIGRNLLLMQHWLILKKEIKPAPSNWQKM